MRKIVALVVCGALASVLALPLAASAAPARMAFPLNVLPGLGHATDLGSVPAGQVLNIGIGLKDSHAAAEQALVTAQRTPGSPSFGHYLTPSQYTSRFGVPQAKLTKVLAWLRGGGAHVMSVAGARNYVEVRATAASVERIFQVQMHSYRAGGIDFYANRTAPSVPAGLGVLVVVGLNDLVRPTTPLAGGHQPPGSAPHGGQGLPATGTGQSLPLPGGGQTITLPGGQKLTLPSSVAAPAPPAIKTGSLTPQDMWSIYDEPSSNLGDGQQIAVIGSGQSSTTVSALRTFEDHHGLPHVPVTVTQIPAGGDFSDTGGNVEWELDTQASTGMAPHAKNVHLYFGQHLIDPDVESAFASWASDPHGPQQANASFGECETTPANATLENPLLGQFNNNGDPNAQFGTGAPNALEPVAEQTLRQAVLEGRTLFASTGDTGSSCPVLVLGPAGAGNGIANEGVPLPNYPAVSQYAVAVGGSVLYSDGATPPKRGLEYPWPYTGGGQSFFISEPAFQRGDAAVNRPCVSDPSGGSSNTGKTCRGIPDVASESGDIATSAYTIYSPELGGDSSEGGTSLSSPLWVGMWTRMQAGAAHGTGFADNPIYRTAENPAKYARDFYDLQAGTNGFYQAAPGWDYVSGWGVPDLTKLMQDIDGRTTVARP